MEEKLQLKIEEMLETIDKAIQTDVSSLKQEGSLFEKERISSEALQAVVNKVEKELKNREEQLEEMKEVDGKKEKKRKKSMSSKKTTHRLLFFKAFGTTPF